MTVCNVNATMMMPFANTLWVEGAGQEQWGGGGGGGDDDGGDGERVGKADKQTGEIKR